MIDRVSKGGNDRAYDLPRFKITHKDRTPGPAGVRPPGFEKALEHRADFSFSGLKTAVLRLVQAREGRPFSEPEMADLCASFQRAVVDALLTRTFEAAGWFGAKSIGIAGGVSANSRLRADAVARGEQAGHPRVRAGAVADHGQRRDDRRRRAAQAPRRRHRRLGRQRQRQPADRLRLARQAAT